MSPLDAFIDDFRLTKEIPGVPGRDDRFGYLAALVPASEMAAIQACVKSELDAVRAEGFQVHELHGLEIATGAGPWRAIPVRDRVAILRRILNAAKTAGVHFIWEYIRSADPVFQELRQTLYEGLLRRPVAHRRWAPDADPRLVAATLVRRVAALYAHDSLNATSVTIYEDRGIPIDMDHERGLFGELLRRRDLRIQCGCDSKIHSGIQLSDLAATVLRTGLKVSRNLELATETSPPSDWVKADAFMFQVMESDLMDMLEMRVRTHRAVDQTTLVGRAPEIVAAWVRTRFSG